jgi:ubiquinone/menaquinone biosynthesis C-methylase UbiE
MVYIAVGFMEQEEVWDRIAGKWGEFRDRPTVEVLDFLKGRSGRVLDLGCGSGRHSPLNLKMEDGLEFYGVDFSSELLRLAEGKGYVELKKGKVFEIPHEDGFFDYVVFSRVLHCVDSVERRQRSLEEVYRVLRGGGEALVTSWGRGQKRLKNVEKETEIPWSCDGEKFMRYTYVYDAEELRRELEDVGFRVLKEWEDGNIGFVVGKG